MFDVIIIIVRLLKLFFHCGIVLITSSKGYCQIEVFFLNLQLMTGIPSNECVVDCSGFFPFVRA